MISRTIRYLGINLTKEVKNYRTLMKEIEEDIKRWKSIPCLWIGRINIVKMFMLPRANYAFNAILIQIDWHFSKSWNKQGPEKTPHSQDSVEK